jgi:hypothetical protein
MEHHPIFTLNRTHRHLAKKNVQIETEENGANRPREGTRCPEKKKYVSIRTQVKPIHNNSLNLEEGKPIAPYLSKRKRDRLTETIKKFSLGYLVWKVGMLLPARP